MLYYEEMGEGEPLLLIHGLGSSIRDWELQVDPFAKHFRVIAVDMRGHGRSAKPLGPYSIPMFAADTAAFLRAREIKSAHVLGISLGGMIAFQLAVDAPDLLRSLVIVNSMPAIVPKSFGERWQLWRRAAIVELLGMQRMGEFLAFRLFPKPEQEMFRQALIERWAQNDKKAFLAAMRSFVGWDVTDRLPLISCPTLVISADEDYWPLAEKEAYVKQIPGAELVVIADSRHATPIDQVERFNTAVLTFLKGVRAEK